MVQGSFNDIILVCGNHGDDYTNEMKIKEYMGAGDTAFYSCPQYKSIYGNVHGLSCNNRIGINDYMKILSEITEYAYDDSEEVDLVGLDSRKLATWKKKGLVFKVVGKTEDDRYIVAVVNKTAMAR